MNRLAVFLSAIAACFSCPAAPGVADALSPAPIAARHQLLIVIDGLRPDYIRAEWMPNLHALSQKGVWFEHHHAVFPTVTRVNSASISTGTYPERHGLVDNTLYVPAVSEQLTLSTADYMNLRRIKDRTGRLLEVPTLGEYMEKAGKRLIVCSSGSSGSAFLLNPEIKGIGIINVEMQAPADLAKAVEAQLGPPPPDETPNSNRNHWMVDAYLQFGLRDFQADAALMWITDPDHTAHTEGMGSEKMVASLKAVDGEIGRILAAIEAAGAQDQVNIMVTSDHGFSTLNSAVNPLAVLYQYMGEQGRPMSDVVLAGQGIYFKRDAEILLPGLVKALQGAEWVGSIYAPGKADDSAIGMYPGTLSMTAIHYASPRAPHLLISPQWSDRKNEHGFAGSAELPGVAGHGSDSPFDIHNTLIACGPSFGQGVRIEAPSCNVDLAPTLCALMQMDVPEVMQGRVLREAFNTPVPPAETAAVTTSDTAVLDSGSYTVTGHWSKLGDYTYYDYGEGKRSTTHTPAPDSSGGQP